MNLASIIENLDRKILNDPSLDSSRFAQLIQLQRELGLLHGQRPTCPFLRPHIIDHKQYSTIAEAAEVIALAIEKMVASALTDEALAIKLGLTEAELKLARVDPGYSPLCVTSRLDAYLSESGFQFLEYNAESPAGVGDQMQLEKLLLPLDHNQVLLSEYRCWKPEPHRELLLALMDAYREWGGEEERPNIAIVDWQGVATESEFHVLQQYFESCGHKTTIADPRSLRRRDDALWANDFRVDIVYKRVIIHEFLERLGQSHPLATSYAEGEVCMANSFRSKVAHKKAGFAILSDPAYSYLFSELQLDVISRHIPWTRIFERGRTLFESTEYDLLSLARAERERMVLKPNDDYGGHGVFIGWLMDEREWEQAIMLALERPYVIQERVPVKKISIPLFTDRVSREEMYVDFNPFLFANKVEGALVRLSSSALLNVTSGGGQTALLVLEGGR
jgi:hypothetical protein